MEPACKKREAKTVRHAVRKSEKITLIRVSLTKWNRPAKRVMQRPKSHKSKRVRMLTHALHSLWLQIVKFTLLTCGAEVFKAAPAALLVLAQHQPHAQQMHCWIFQTTNFWLMATSRCEV
jgi:hypothetical protein